MGSGDLGSGTRQAVVFGGQGSQRPGMAEPWRGTAAFARWREAEDLLSRPLLRLATEADADELREPVNCQTALFVHQVVVYEEWLRRVETVPLCFAGHSLGEYDALFAAGALSFADALALVHARAVATAEAARLAPGGMMACLGHPDDAVEEAAARAGAHVCNDNAPGQVVVAGAPAALEKLQALLATGPGRTIRLQVGAAYHSPAMAPAVPRLADALSTVSLRDTRVPVLANVDARPHDSAADWPDLLLRQLVSPVRWRESVLTLAELGVTELVELGASSVLAGLAKRTVPGMARSFVGSPDALEVAA